MKKIIYATLVSLLFINLASRSQTNNNDSILLKSLSRNLGKINLPLTDTPSVCRQFLFQININKTAVITSIESFTTSKEDSLLIKLISKVDKKWLMLNRSSVCILPIYILNDSWGEQTDNTLFLNTINFDMFKSLSNQNMRYIKPFLIYQITTKSQGVK